MAKVILFFLCTLLVVIFYLSNFDTGVNIPRLQKNDIIFVNASSWRGKIMELFGWNKFTHVGIVGDNNMIIHASPSTGMIGKVSIVSSDEFFNHVSEYKIVHFQNALFDTAQKEIGKPFDHDFNRHENNKIYCTELIENSLKEYHIDISKSIAKDKILYPDDILKILEVSPR